MLLPQQAVTRTAQGDTVLVVGADDKPQRSGRCSSAARGDDSGSCSAGLQPGERVIVEGFQKMRPGAPVKPVPWTPAPRSAAARAAPQRRARLAAPRRRRQQTS